jgi:hypothetical protein
MEGALAMRTTSWAVEVARITAIVAVFVARTAGAATWTEIGDAGQLPGTAQVTKGTGPLTLITGHHSPNDADAFLIRITDPATFSATTDGLANWDTQLFLFTPDGFGVYYNDDISASDRQSTLPVGNPNGPTTPGLYILAISEYNMKPSSTGGLIFPTIYPGVFGATGPGAGAALSTWNNDGADDADYAIALTGAAPAVSLGVPTLSAWGLVLACLFLAGVGAFALRRREITGAPS